MHTNGSTKASRGEKLHNGGGGSSSSTTRKFVVALLAILLAVASFYTLLLQQLNGSTPSSAVVAARQDQSIMVDISENNERHILVEKELHALRVKQASLEKSVQLLRGEIASLKEERQKSDEIISNKVVEEEAATSEIEARRSAAAAAVASELRRNSMNANNKELPQKLPPHQVHFAKYGTWSGTVPEGYDPGHESLFLGVLTACEAQLGWATKACTQNLGKEIQNAPYPPFGDHTFEWLDMMHAIEHNKEKGGDDRFNMLELGAGWTKWVVDGVALANRIGRKDIMAIGVEAQEQHCEWARKHMALNLGATTDQAKLICGAVASEDGFVEFPVASAADTGARYGLGIQYHLDGKNTGFGVKRVQSYGFCTLVNQPEFGGHPIDFVSLDVQSFEHAILAPTSNTLECLRSKVKVLHISLHRVEENDARELTNTLVGRLGWDLVRYFPLASTKIPTEFGTVVEFGDGVLTFVNPLLAPDLALKMYNAKNIHKGPYTTYRGKRMRESVAADWKGGNYITDIQKSSIS